MKKSWIRIINCSRICLKRTRPSLGWTNNYQDCKKNFNMWMEVAVTPQITTFTCLRCMKVEEWYTIYSLNPKWISKPWLCSLRVLPLRYWVQCVLWIWQMQSHLSITHHSIYYLKLRTTETKEVFRSALSKSRETELIHLKFLNPLQSILANRDLDSQAEMLQ